MLWLLCSILELWRGLSVKCFWELQAFFTSPQLPIKNSLALPLLHTNPSSTVLASHNIPFQRFLFTVQKVIPSHLPDSREGLFLPSTRTVSSGQSPTIWIFLLLFSVGSCTASGSVGFYDGRSSSTWGATSVAGVVRRGESSSQLLGFHDQVISDTTCLKILCTWFTICRCYSVLMEIRVTCFGDTFGRNKHPF